MKNKIQKIFLILAALCFAFALTACGGRQEETTPSASVPEASGSVVPAASGKTETKKPKAAADPKDGAEEKKTDAAADSRDSTWTQQTGTSGTAPKTVSSKETGKTSGNTSAAASQTQGGSQKQGSTPAASGSTQSSSSPTKTSGGSTTGSQTQKPAEPQAQQTPAEPQTKEPQQTVTPVSQAQQEEEIPCGHYHTYSTYKYYISGCTPFKYRCPHCGQDYANNGDLHAHWLEETGGEYGEVWLVGSGGDDVYLTTVYDVSREEAEEVARQYAAMHPELESVGISGWCENHCYCSDCGKMLY